MTSTDERASSRGTGLTFASLIRRSVAELDRLVSHGHAVRPEDLAGHEYRGRNVGTPGSFERRFRKFQKLFFLDPETGRFGGWNLRARQNADDEPWLDAPPTAREPLSLRARLERAIEWSSGLRGPGSVMGFYELRPPRPGERIDCPRGGLIIDYGGGLNPWGDVSAALRDIVVAARPGDARLLLGRAYVAVGALRIRAPGVFVMERACAIRDPTPIRSRRWFSGAPPTPGARVVRPPS